jgi:hypothetical protein
MFLTANGAAGGTRSLSSWQKVSEPEHNHLEARRGYAKSADGPC